MDRFNRTAEKNKQQPQKEPIALFDPEASGKSPATAYIETTKQTYDLDVQYLSVIQGNGGVSNAYGGLYNAFVCKLPHIKPGHAPYKLFVRESIEES